MREEGFALPGSHQQCKKCAIIQWRCLTGTAPDGRGVDDERPRVSAMSLGACYTAMDELSNSCSCMTIQGGNGARSIDALESTRKACPALHSVQGICDSATRSHNVLEPSALARSRTPRLSAKTLAGPEAADSKLQRDRGNDEE